MTSLSLAQWRIDYVGKHIEVLLTQHLRRRGLSPVNSLRSIVIQLSNKTTD
jgi:hypothetical protein